MVVGALALVGCSTEPAAPETPVGQAPAQTAKGGNEGLAKEAPEMTPPPGAPTADEIVGSKAKGGN